MTEERKNQKQEGSKVKTFPVSFALGEIKENITITTNSASNTSKEQKRFGDQSKTIKKKDTNTITKPSKDQIINQAFKFHSQGNIKEAAKNYQYFINQGFSDHMVFSNYGAILRDLGNLQDAELYTRKAIKINPNYALAYSNLGNVLKDLGKSQDAELSYRKAIQINPNYADAHYNLGIILKELGNLQDAELSYRKAIQINPNYADAYSNLGNVLKDLDNLQDAELSYRKAIQINPSYADAYSNLGNVLKDLGNLQDAELSYRKAIQINPDYAEAHFNLGNLLKDLGKLQEAKKVLKKSIEIEPNNLDYLSTFLFVLLILCDWDEIEKYSADLNLIETDLKTIINPFHLMHLEDNPENELKLAIKYSQINKSDTLPNLTSYSHSKINIGYFSSDFRNHAVSFFLARIFELHDSSRFNIYAYSLRKESDGYTERIKNAVFCFREVSDLNDIEIVNIARDDQIDIAIDLNGITKSRRKYIFEYRVAPIQINYFGYPGTMGSESYDFRITKKIIVPEEDKKFYTEKILYLPDNIIPIDDTQHISTEKFSREELGLPLDSFVFTCFNRTEKITRKEFDIWMRLLKKIDNSVLWLIKPHKAAIENLYSELNKQSMNKERIVFAEFMNLNDHLSRHEYGDLFLDTFNYNAGTTGALSLWAGLPIITLAGKTNSSRASAGFLNALDLNGLITYNEYDYESLAYELATNKKKLEHIRNKLKNKQSSCFDPYKYTIELEKLYTDINSKL